MGCWNLQSCAADGRKHRHWIVLCKIAETSIGEYNKGGLIDADVVNDPRWTIKTRLYQPRFDGPAVAEWFIDYERHNRQPILISGEAVVYRKVKIVATVNLDDAKAHLPEIISGLNPGEQVVIVNNGEPMAMLTRACPKQGPCTAGSAKDTRHWMAPDFDAPLEDFREYME